MGIRQECEERIANWIDQDIMDTESFLEAIEALQYVGAIGFLCADISECPEGEPVFFEVGFDDVEKLIKVFESYDERIEDLLFL